MNNLRTLLFCGAAGAMLTLLPNAAARASLITFDSLSTGAIVGSQYFVSDGVTISAENFHLGHPDIATIFNTNKTNTPDKDLQTGWVAGNLVGQDLGKILIVAENAIDNDNNGRIDTPDDEHDGGRFFINFNSFVGSLGFDLIDVEFSTPNDYVEFFRNGVSLGTIGFDEFVDPSSQYYDPTVVYGDHTANRIAPISIVKIGIGPFNSVVFHMGECMAMDNIQFAPLTVAPEPGMAVVLAGVPVLLGMRRRRR
jgi:hypothetical protein